MEQETPEPKRVEVVPGGCAVFRGENMNSYYCPQCDSWIFSQYEGDEPAFLASCGGFMGDHRLEWR